MSKSLIVIGKSEYIPIIQNFGFEYREFSDESRLKLLSSLKKTDDLAVAACCITDSCLETIISRRHEITRHGLEVFVLNLDDGCKTFEDLEKLSTSMIAGIIAVTPLTVVKDFKLLEQSILSSPPKVLFEENNRLPKERKYFVPRDQRSLKSVYSCQKHFPRRIMRRWIGSNFGPIFWNIKKYLLKIIHLDIF